MAPFLHRDGRNYHIAVLDRGARLRTPFQDRLFPCLIWDMSGDWTQSDRAQLAQDLLAAGCRYAVCAGQTCERWHLAVDCAFVDLGLDPEGPEWEARYVMTTSHEGETIDDVVFFFVLCTNFDQHDFTDFLILQLGADPVLEQSLRGSVTAIIIRDPDSEDSSAETIQRYSRS